MVTYSVKGQPANDNFEGRVMLSGYNVSASGSNVSATTQTGEPSRVGGVRYGATVWWGWVAPASGTVTIDTVGSSFNTVLGVYTGTLASGLVTIADNNDIGGGTNTSRVTFTAVAGTEYKILVGGTRIFGSSYNTGTVRLRIVMNDVLVLSSPANGSYYAYGAGVTFSATTAISSASVQRLEFYRSNTLIGTATKAPYSITVTNLPLGQQQCYAVMVDTSNMKATSVVVTVTILNPGITITSPSDGTIFTDYNPISISAMGLLASGSFTNVGFYVDGEYIGEATAAGVSTPSYSKDWTNVVSGIHRITSTGWTDSGVVYVSAPVYIAVPYTLVPSNSVWKYLDNGTDQGTAWQLIDFDDSGWGEGKAELGYGDSAEGRPENTVISYGPDANNKYITYYFRKKIVISDPSFYTNFVIRVMRDDGAVVYINGQEVGRFNMPTGTISYTNLTSNATDDGQVFYASTVSPSRFVSGTNIIAVEVHQTTVNSTDLSFDFELYGIPVIVKNLTPILSLNSPTNNAYYLGPKSISLSANASDSDGSVVRVEFYVDDVLVGSATNPPYSAVWQSPGIGTHLVKVVAVDDMNGATTVTASVVVYDGVGTPLVTITSPKDQTVYSNLSWWTNVNITASVFCPEDIKEVKFYANGMLIGSDSAAPYSYVWNNAAFGTNSIVVSAEGSSGVIGTSKPITVVLIEPPRNTNPPVIAVVSPYKGLIISTLSEIQVTFSENVTGVDASDLLVNGVPALSVSGSGSNYVFTVAQPEYGLVNITWATNHGIIDFGYPSGLPFDGTASGSTWTYQLLDFISPTVVSQDPPAGAMVSVLSQITVVFSEAVTNVDAADLLINNAPAMIVRGGGTTYTFGFAQPSYGTVNISWSPYHGITDLAASPNPFIEANSTWSYTLDPRVVLVETNSVWKFIKGTNEASNPINAWRMLSFVDSNWSNAPSPFFYGDTGYTNAPNQGTYLSDMQGGYSCIYLRKLFVVPNINAVTSLFMNAQCDDGFVAYINGVEVLRYNVPGGDIPYNGLASSPANEPNGNGAAWINYTLTNITSYLVEGTNVLCVQAFNNDLSSSTDFGFNAQLYTYLLSPELVPPKLVSITPSAGVVYGLNSIKITFSEPVTNVDASDILVNGSAAQTVVASEDKSEYTFQFAQPAYGSVSVSFAANHNIVDLDPVPKAFDASSIGSWQYTLLNPNAPYVVNQTPLAGSVVTQLTSLTLNFSVPVTGVNASDLLINGSPATNMQGSNTTFTFYFPQPAAGTVSISWANNNGITDLSSPPNSFNQYQPGNIWSYTVIDKTPPYIVNVVPAADSVVSNLTMIYVVFNEPVTGIDPSDLLLNGVPAKSLATMGTTYRFTFSVPNASTLRVTWSPYHGITDLAAEPNAFNATAPGSTWTYHAIDKISPSIKLITPPAGVALTELSQITVTFDEEVSGVSTDDLLINSRPARTVMGSGAGPYTFTFAPVLSGTVEVRWNADQDITDFGTPPNKFAGGEWVYYIVQNVSYAGQVVINEIMFNSISGKPSDEWVELYNTTTNLINLNGFKFTKGIDYTFPNVSIPGRGYLVVAADTNAFRLNYPGVTNVVGNWSGGLANTDESIELDSPLGEVVNRVHYASEGDWAQRVRGSGAQLVESMTRSGTTATITIQGHGIVAGDAVIISGADQPEYNGRFTVGSVGTSTFTITVSGSPATPATGRIICFRVSDRGASGVGWFCGADGFGNSLELVNPNMPNDCGQNWASSSTLYGTPGKMNSVTRDNIAPLILNVTHIPAIPRSTNSVIITAKVIDEIPSGVQNVTLFYRNHTSQNPPGFSSAQMFDDGSSGDGVANDGIYGTVLSPMANGTIIEFYVQATDVNENVRTYPAGVLEANGVNNTYGTTVQSANALFRVDDEIISDVMPSVRLVMTATDRAQFPPSNTSSDAEFNSTMISTDGTGTEVRYSCGVRVRGAGTRGRTPKNNRLNIPNDNRWNNLKAVNLNCQFVHAALVGNVLSQKSGLPAADAHVIQYRINGVNLAPTTAPQNGTGNGAGWGTFLMLKPVNGDLLDDLFPDDQGGNVYRASTGNWNANLTYYDTNPTTYLNHGYFKTSNQSENDWTDLINLCYAFSSVANESDYIQAIKTNVNVTYWMRYFAVGTLLNYGETALFNGIADDYALYRGLKDRRFVLIGHDFDTVLGQGDTGSSYYPINTNSSIYIMLNPPNPNANSVPVLRRFMTNANFAPLFYGELKRLCDTVFHPDNLNPLLDQLLSGWGIGPDATTINNMKTWANNRRAIALSQIPLELTVSNALSQQSGYLRATAQNINLYGAANAIHTRKVLVNGVQANWYPQYALWTNAISLTPGINRVLIQSVNSNGVVFASTNIDIWYDSGTTKSVSGAISSDTVWTAANGPYRVTGSVTVNSGVTLTIQPGASVYLDSGVSITVASGGKLIAEGTPTAQIRFTRAPGTTGTWGGITINGGAGTPETRIAYAIIEYNGSTAIHSSGGTVYLDHIIFNTTSVQYLSLDSSSFTVSYCHFPTPTGSFEPIHGTGGIKAGGKGIFYRNFVGAANGYNDAIDFTGGNRPSQPIVQFIENVFAGSSDDMLDLDGTDAWVEGNIFMHCHRNGAPDTSSGVSGGSDSGNTSEITIVRNIFYDCDHSAMAKQGNFYTFLNNTVVRITHAGGTDTDSAVIAVADEGYPESAGVYIEGNIIVDATKLLQFLTNAVVTVTNNIMPFSWGGAGGGNQNINPMLKYIPQLSETYFTNWEQAQVMWDWFSLKTDSPAIGIGPNGTDLGAVIPRGVSVSGAPYGTSSLISLTLNVGINRSGNGIPASSWQNGSGYTHYKWRLDNGGWSPEIPIATPITIQDLFDGPHYVEVIGKNDAGYYQNDAIYGESATVTRTHTWVVKSSLPPIKINEVLSSNQKALIVNGKTPDLVELYNESNEPFDLVGIRLTDDQTNPDKFIFPTNSIIPAHGYVVVYCDNPSGTNGYFTGFGLNQDGDDLYLYDSRERGGALIDSIVFGPQITDFSIGRTDDGSWTLTTPTFGSANRLAAQGSPYKLKINEWLALGEAPFANDFVELYNTDSLPVNVAGLYISDSIVSYWTKHQFPQLSFISGYGFLRFFADGDSSQGPLHLSFKLSGFQGGIGLYDTNLIAIDIVTYQSQWKNISQGRSPNGSDKIVYFTQSTPGSPNPLITTTTVSGGALVINEALAVNNGLAELDGSTPDWVELYNGTTNRIDLSDYSLSDDTQEPRKFIFPSGTTLASGQFLRVFCDKDKAASTNNTGFGLSGSGGGIYLYDKPANGGSLLDSIVYGIQAANLSIGRVPDGSTNWVLTAPTPQTQNAAITQLGSPQSLRINEWMASPKSGSDWFEIYNPENQPVIISGLFLTDNLTQRFKHQIAPLSFIGAKTYQIFFADNNTGSGADHTSFALSASGEALGMFYPDGALIDAITFGSQDSGVSEGRFPDGSTNIFKFPLTVSDGQPNYLILTNIVVNEILTRTMPPYEDAIEIYNLTDKPLDISGWWLSDDFNTLEKYQFKTPTIVPANGYTVIYAQQFTNRDYAAIPFALNANGDEVVLSEARNGQLTGFRTYAKFGTAAPNVSFGRYVTSDGKIEYVAMKSRTFGKDDAASVEEFRTGTGAPNSSPLVGPVVISEIMYHPPELGTNDNVDYEYIELRNITSVPVALYDTEYPTNTWRIRDAVKYDFTTGVVLQPYEEILLVSFDPMNNPSLLQAFKQTYKIESGVRIFGPYAGKLSNKDADIEIERPFTPTTNTVPYIRVEHVHYYDSTPWPAEADGIGLSLNRLDYNSFGNDPTNWSADPPSPGPQPLPLDFDRDGIPDVWERQFGLDPLSSSDAEADYDGDGYSNLQEYLAGTNPLDPKSVLQFDSSTAGINGTNMFININVPADRAYTIEYIDSLGGNWLPLYQLQSAPSNRVITIQIPIDASMRFYRLRVP